MSNMALQCKSNRHMSKTIKGGTKMPGLNKTGPQGQGPMTGRQMGNCTGARPVAFYGRGMGRVTHGFGRGRGFRNRSFAMGIGRGFRFNQNYNTQNVEYSPEDEKQFLQEQKEFLRNQLNEIDKQLQEL